MKTKIHHPKLLLAVLLVIVGGTSAAVLWVEGRDPTGAGPAVSPAIPTNQEVAPEQSREAVDIVKKSVVVKDISGNQDWEASSIYGTLVGGRNAVTLDATWKTPVTSSGPWLDIECQGAHKVVVSSRFSNITKLTFLVEMEQEVVAGYSVGAPEEDTIGAIQKPLEDDTNIKIYDTKTGNLVYDGRLADLDAMCPDGSEDD